MGLRRNYETDYGLTAPNAYYRIKDVRGNSSGSIYYNIEIYYDKAAKDAGNSPLITLGRSLPAAVSSRFGIAHEIYQTIKSDPEFSGAEDVFEDGGFSQIQNTYFSNAYILKATLASGTLSNGLLANATINGKCLIDNQIVYGTFTNVDAHNVVDDGYGNLKGFADNVNADGYVVQLLII